MQQVDFHPPHLPVVKQTNPKDQGFGGSFGTLQSQPTHVAFAYWYNDIYCIGIDEIWNKIKCHMRSCFSKSQLLRQRMHAK
jgi:hypothetical protein